MICVRKKDKQAGWVSIDFQDDEEIEAVIVIPTFGPDHNAGMDCWCHPERGDEGVIVHNEHH
jgi:hypothetical protein